VGRLDEWLSGGGGGEGIKAWSEDLA
jgi:hypothetical protein